MMDNHSNTLNEKFPNEIYGNNVPHVETALYLALYRLGIWWILGPPITVLCFYMIAIHINTAYLTFKWEKLMKNLNVYVPYNRKANNNATEALKIPKHIAVIMDGNRRYGKSKYGNSVRGHTDGSRTLVSFVDWCIEAGIDILTVYAFSTENWNRSKVEVDALMNIFDRFMDLISPEAIKKNIRVRILIADSRMMPKRILLAADDIERQTSHCDGFLLNVCVSYGSRTEITGACKSIVYDVIEGNLNVEDIDESVFQSHLLTGAIPDPDILIRTSGELRLSNFLLFQLAYSELIFLQKFWPDITKDDLYSVIKEFNRRKRRYGK